jgi:alcohol dehydrogenase, propanol-preferring
MPWLYSSYGHCEHCTRGDEVLCQMDPQVTGATTDGGYAEFMLAPAAYVAPLLDALNFADAPLICAGLTAPQRSEKRRFRAGG